MIHTRSALAPADELHIRNLVARYHHAVYERDEAAWRASWTADCRWSLGADRIADGVDAAAAIWRESLSRYAWIVQVASNGEVWRDGDHAAGRWTLQEYSQTVDGRTLLRVARYDDRYAFGDGVWRFAARRYEEVLCSSSIA